MKHAVISGLLASGADCQDAGIVPTPTLGLSASAFNAAIMITASHNPPQYNGLKLINPDGSAFGEGQQKQLEEIILQDDSVTSEWDGLGSVIVCADAVPRHIERISRDFNGKINAKVVLDCGCGAGSVITPYLLKHLGCDVMGIDCYPSGFFPRRIEPKESTLENLMRAVKEYGADVGIAHDGDADRMMAVDDKGRFIPGDKLLVLLAQDMNAKDIVTTVDASMAIDEAGFSVRRTKVGDTFVSDSLLKEGGDFGGEPSGSWVFPEISLCPDGIYAAARIASIASRNKLSEMVDAIPDYFLLRGSLDSQGLGMAEMESSLQNLEPLSVDKIDGLKLNFIDGWMLVRSSGTEPKIRLTVEGRTEERMRELYDSGIRIISNCAAGNREMEL